MTKSYRDLHVWQAAMDLAVRIYRLTERFPKEEKFGLSQQIRRAAASISSNIAEGYGRRTHRQTYHFLENALGSTFEVETQLELAVRLRYVTEDDADLFSEIKAIGKGINGLMRYVERDAQENSPPRP